MKRYYELRSDFDHFAWLGVENDAEVRRLMKVGSVAVGASWDPVELVRLDECPGDEELPLSDFPEFLKVVRCFSKAAASALDRFLSSAGEYLPCTGMGDRFILWHCTTELDVVVQNNLRSLPPVSPRIVIDGNKADGYIFGLSTIRSAIVVSEEFKAVVDEHDLIGFVFDHVGVD